AALIYFLSLLRSCRLFSSFSLHDALPILFKLGIQLFFFYIVLGFSMSVLTELISNIETSTVPDFSESWELAFMAVLGVFLLAKIPAEASSYITQDTEFSISSILPSQVKT